MAVLLLFKSITLVRAAVPGMTPAPPVVVAPARAEAAPKPADPHARLPESGNKAAVVGPALAPAAGGAPAARLTMDDPPVSESERGLLLSLRQRRTEIEAREGALAEREAILSAAEKRLSARLDELTNLQRRLEALETARKDRDEANWRGLVKVYENMKPRDAASIFNDLDLPVLLQVVDRMKETKAALVLAAMQPDRARQLTAELAQLRAHLNTPAPATVGPTNAVVPNVPVPATVSPNANATDGKGKT